MDNLEGADGIGCLEELLKSFTPAVKFFTVGGGCSEGKVLKINLIRVLARKMISSLPEFLLY